MSHGVRARRNTSKDCIQVQTVGILGIVHRDTAQFVGVQLKLKAHAFFDLAFLKRVVENAIC